MVMDLNVFFKDYFEKTVEERDELLVRLSTDYINACKQIDMDTLDMHIHLNDLIEGYERQEKYEQAEAFYKIRLAIEEVLIEEMKKDLE